MVIDNSHIIDWNFSDGMMVKRTVIRDSGLPVVYHQPIDCDTIFKFSFKPYRCKSDKLKYSVYAYSREDMELFLKQHNFIIDQNTVIECYTIDEFNDDEDLILKHFKFKSNMSNDLFTIVSSSNIVNEAINMVCSNMSQHLELGPPSIRTDIEIIDIINKLIYELPHAFILDHTIIDDSGEIQSVDWDKYIKSFDGNWDGLSSMDDSYIYDSMHHNSCEENVQPITIEAYVEYFTSMITDVFE